MSYVEGNVPGVNGTDGKLSGQQRGRTDYDPGAVQDEINELMALIEKNSKGGIAKKDANNMLMYYLFFLMQEYGAQSTGLESNNVGKLNNYLDGMNDLSNYFYSANDPSVKDSSAMDKAFLAAIAKMEKQLNDPTSWFNTSDQGKEMKKSVLTALDSLKTQVKNGEKEGPNGLFNIWAKFDPSLTGGTGGDTTNINPFLSQIGQLNQQFTGASQVVSANAQTIAKTWQSEQDSFNNFGKALFDMMKFLTQQQRVT